MSLFSSTKAPARPSGPTPFAPQHQPRPMTAAPLVFKGFDCIPADPRLITNINLIKGWGLRKLDYCDPIKAEEDIPFVTLPQKLVELIKKCWQMGNVDTNAQRSRLQIGMNAPLANPLGNRVVANAPRGDNARYDQVQARIDQLKGSWKPADIMELNRLNQIHNSQAKPIGPLEERTIATDFNKTAGIERVAAYTFRGDSRSPQAIEAAGGFHPPITRTDQYYVDNVIFPYFQKYMATRYKINLSLNEFQSAYRQTFISEREQKLAKSYVMWRTLVETESHHIGRMISKEDLKGYVSTSRSFVTARQYASENIYTGAKYDGWVYVTLVRGGFNLTKTSAFTSTSEQEIAFPGSLTWNDVFGFRHFSHGSGGMTGPVYLRAGFKSRNPTAYKRVYEFMCGKDQREGVLT